MELQGQVGDLGQQSRLELQELLLRQEKILSNRRLLQTLPDKGRKIKEFAEKIRLAIEQRNEEERRQSLVSDARAEFQSKYMQASTIQKCAVSATPVLSPHNQQCEPSTVSGCMKENVIMDKEGDHSFSTAAAIESMETAATGASLNSDLTKESDLVEALERVTLSETGTGLSLKPKEPKKPHIVAVLEKADQSSAHRRQRFKPNMLLQKGSTSPSGSSSLSQSSEGLSPLSAQARKERDRKHLDDITAARMPPLHHSPTQLLTLEESAILLKEQTKKWQELQAKLAAQKLSEGLKISMGSFTPDGGPMAAYREVHDEGAQLSADED